MARFLTVVTLLVWVSISAFADSFDITVHIMSTKDASIIPTGDFMGSFSTDGICVLCTTLSGITSFQIPVQTGPGVAGPGTVVFDALDAANKGSAFGPQYNSITTELSNPNGVIDVTEDVHLTSGGTETLILELTPTDLNTPNTAEIRPQEGQLALGTYEFTHPAAAVPEPSSLVLLSSCLAIVGFFSRRTFFLRQARLLDH
jgi:hypothetical protein